MVYLFSSFNSSASFFIFIASSNTKAITLHTAPTAKNITVYSDKNCNKVKFKINKGSKIYITELYKNGNKKLIKVKSTEGKTGYVKIGTKLLFTKKSCVWAR